MQNFSDFDLPKELQATLAKMQFTTPTPIQSEAIPVALAGQDILGSAQTGTGKTAAFLLPIITKLMESNNETALILTPTRELAKQIFDFANLLLERNKIRAALLIGGAPIFLQLRQLSMGARLIIGTPGRVNDHIGRNELLLKNTKFLVLDETDLMLDMGFSEQINDILEYMPPQRQTLLFSATLPDQILKLSEKYLVNPKRIAIGKVTNVASNIVEDIVYTTREGKYDELVKALDHKTGTIIVFVKTKMDAEHIAKKLQKEKHKVDFLHGGLRQSRRDRVTKLFRTKGFRIMIATDVAARGLDIPHIEHVINYDMPESHEDYIHRIGRTARAAASGCALSLITSKHRVNNIKEFFDLSKGRPMRSGGGRSRSSFGGRSGGFGGRSGGFGGRSEGRSEGRGFGSRAPRGEYRGDRSESRSSSREEAGSESRSRFGSKPSGDYASRAPRSEYRGDRSQSRPSSRGEGRPSRFGGDNISSYSSNSSQSREAGSESRSRFSDRAPRSEYRGDRSESRPSSRDEGRRFGSSTGRSTGSNDSNSFSNSGYRSINRGFGGSRSGESAGGSFRKFNRNKD
jgi:ATP-dependent RNA helicase DeaD